jgi:uncharacterized Fe-S radical SAM superfamily protein PflX
VSAFYGLAVVEDLPGFAKFVLRFLVHRSLWLGNDKSRLYVNILGKNQMRFLTPNIYKETAVMKVETNIITSIAESCDTCENTCWNL